MSTEAITAKILSDAEARKQKIEEETEKTVREIREETERKKQGLQKELRENIDRELTERLERERSQAEQSVRIEDERARRKILDSLFSKELERLKSLSSDEYVSLLAPLVKTTLPSDFSGTCLLPRERAQESRQALAQAGFSSVHTEENGGHSGGVICTSPQEHYDLSFESLIRDIKEKHEADVAGILFG